METMEGRYYPTASGPMFQSKPQWKEVEVA
jgi:hypothetical protein